MAWFNTMAGHYLPQGSEPERLDQSPSYEKKDGLVSFVSRVGDTVVNSQQPRKV